MILTLEIIGTIAFAISGALVAVQKKMDVLGVLILGMTTAVGGGIIRDLLLGVTPPAAFQNPIYVIIADVTALIIFLPFTRKLLKKHEKAYDNVLFYMDSVGLGMFTVVGVRASMALYPSDQLLLAIFVGSLTGVGGGVLRDIFAGKTPDIFVKHFYATASILGALLTTLIWNFVPQNVALAVGTVTVILLRLLARHFHWNLPKAE